MPKGEVGWGSCQDKGNTWQSYPSRIETKTLIWGGHVFSISQSISWITPSGCMEEEKTKKNTETQGQHDHFYALVARKERSIIHGMV